jgi:hypothetical protein
MAGAKEIFPALCFLRRAPGMSGANSPLAIFLPHWQYFGIFRTIFCEKCRLIISQLQNEFS